MYNIAAHLRKAIDFPVICRQPPPHRCSFDKIGEKPNSKGPNMDNGFRSIIRSDGSIHLENQIGSLRYDLTDGSVDQILSKSGAFTSISKSNGSIDLEHTIGNMRFTLGKSGFEQIL